MSAISSEDADLIVEHLRLLRAEMNARFDAIDARFDAIDARFDEVSACFREVRQEITDCERELGCLELETIPECYTANLNFADFVDHEWRFVLSPRKERS